MKIQMVTLNSSQGEICRAVVEDLGEILVVCRVEELNAARREGRKPTVVGFKRTSVIDSEVDRLVHTKHTGQYEPVTESQADSGGRRPG
jgi:hypothetical protein